MYASGPGSILSPDNSNSVADIDESSIRAGIINQAATYVRRSLPGSGEESSYWPRAFVSRDPLVAAIALRSTNQNVYFKIRACNIYDDTFVLRNK